MGERDKGLLGGCYYLLVLIFVVVVLFCVLQLWQNDVFYIVFRVYDMRVFFYGFFQVVVFGICDLVVYKGEVVGVVGIVFVLGCNRFGVGCNRMKSGFLVIYLQ